MGPGNARGGGSVREAEGSGLGIPELGRGGFGGVTVGEEKRAEPCKDNGVLRLVTDVPHMFSRPLTYDRRYRLPTLSRTPPLPARSPASAESTYSSAGMAVGIHVHVGRCQSTTSLRAWLDCYLSLFSLSTSGFGAAGCHCFAGLASLGKAVDIVGEAHAFQSASLATLGYYLPPKS